LHIAGLCAGLWDHRIGYFVPMPMEQPRPAPLFRPTRVELLMKLHLRAVSCHLPYGITWCYLQPDTSEHTPPLSWFLFVQVMFNCRSLSDIFWHQYGIALQHVFDCQVGRLDSLFPHFTCFCLFLYVNSQNPSEWQLA